MRSPTSSRLASFAAGVLVPGLLAAGVAACASEPEEEDPAVLAAALEGTRTGGDPAAAEPIPAAGSEPHRLRLSARLTLQVPGEERYWRLGFARTLDRGPGGAWRLDDRRTFTDPAQHRQGHDDGKQVVFDGRRLAVRRVSAPWMERETLGGQEERLLRAAYDVFPVVLAAFGPYLAWDPAAGEPEVAGIPVRWESPRIDPAVAPRSLEQSTLAGLRDHETRWPAWLAATHRPLQASGRVARRAAAGGAGSAAAAPAGGEVLAGEVEIEGEAVVEGEARRFTLSVRQEVEPLPPDVSFALPEPLLSARRPRPWKLLRDVLGDDLSEVYR